MAPKKKGTKKGNDDWASELGESVDPIAVAAQEAKETIASQDAPDDQPEAGGGGLLAALKKNKTKKQKKGKHVDEDYLDGEDPQASNGINGHTESDGIQDLAAKVPEEANAEDFFDVQVTKVKGGKGKQGKARIEAKEDAAVDADEGGELKSKKEKEKEKKEREKQRKKEQVNFLLMLYCDGKLMLVCHIGCEEEDWSSSAYA